MPRQTCSVCKHLERDAIDAAIRKGSPPLRAIAERSGLSLTAVHRHKQHMVVAKGSTIQNIPEEIRRMRIMLAKAKRKGDTSATLAISREIRAWMTFESKNQSVIPGDTGNVEELSRSDALALARAIVESALDDPDVKSWLRALVERIPTGTKPEEEVNDG
jgi:hypothetical protein